MPNCFRLLRGGVAVPIVDVDAEMCRYFSADCDPNRWFRGWYDFVGFDLAMGKSFDEIRASYREDPYLIYLIEVVDWVEANFTVDSWYETRSRPRSPDA